MAQPVITDDGPSSGGYLVPAGMVQVMVDELNRVDEFWRAYSKGLPEPEPPTAQEQMQQAIRDAQEREALKLAPWLAPRDEWDD